MGGHGYSTGTQFCPKFVHMHTDIITEKLCQMVHATDLILEETK